MANQNLSQFTEKLFVADADHTFIWDTVGTISKRVSRNSWLNSGTLTSDAPVTISQTWNGTGSTVFKALVVNATTPGTTSSSSSLLLDLQVGTVSQFSVRKDGFVQVAGGMASPGGIYTSASANLSFGWLNSYTFGLSSAGILGWTSGSDARGAPDTILLRDSASGNTLALRNGANAQTFNVYGTYTSGTSYERLSFSAPTAANAIIGTNKGSGGGTARGLEFQTDGVSRWSISTDGNLLASASPAVDIGAQDSNKPRNVFCGTSFRAPYAYVQYGSGADQGLYFSTNSTSGTWAYLGARSSGVLTLSNGDITDFNRLQLGGTTDTFPAIARDGAGIKFTGAAAGLTAWIKVPPVAVGSLPVAATAGAGARAFVNDALTPVFGSAVTGGGAVAVPVYSTGSAWNVG